MEEFDLIPQCILTYFEENWVGYKRGNRRKAPRFAIASWNTYGRLRAEKPRTTNELEGWHSGIRKLVGKDHPPFYESVENMWKMEALATKTQVDIEFQGAPAYKRQKYIDLTARLNNILDDYDTYDKKYELLRKIAHLIKINH